MCSLAAGVFAKQTEKTTEGIRRQQRCYTYGVDTRQSAVELKIDGFHVRTDYATYEGRTDLRIGVLDREIR